MFVDNHGYKLIEVGDKFGKLTIISIDNWHIQPSGQRKRLYKAKCECGNITIVRGSDLISHHAKSCGHCNDIHIGDRFGRLTIISRADDYIKPSGDHRPCWNCKCDCGNITIVRGDDLISHHIQSCGCLRKEKASLHFATHNLSNTRIYGIYTDMKYRCYNSNAKAYKNYGGRGIIICDEWLGNDGFINFYNWSITHGYADNLTIDRINVDGNYEPNNCRWIPKEYQSSNLRRNKYVYFNNEKYTIPQLSNILGISVQLLKYRLKSNNFDLSSLFTYITNK